MRGLLRKEWYTLVKYCRMFLVVILVFIGVSAVNTGSQPDSIFLFYPTIMAGIIPITLIGYDERSRWDVYAQTFPYSRAQLVSAKYLVGLLCSLAAWALSGAALCFSPAGAAWGRAARTALLCITLSGSMIAPSLMLPIAFRYGAEKGRIVIYVILALVSLGSVALGSGSVPVPAGAGSPLAPFLLLGAMTAVYAASWLLSIRLYKNREF